MRKTAKLRPFVEYIESEPGFSAVVISGAIVDGACVIKAFGTQLVL